MAQCKAISKYSGRRCRQTSIRGAAVCRMHGGMAPQVQRVAAVRRTLQELLREMPQRPWHEVYAEALHVNDVIMRHARNKVETGETLDPGELDQLVQAAGRAGLLAKGASDIGVSQRLALQQELAGQVVVRVLGSILDAMELPAEFRAWVHGRVTAELRAIEGADEHGRLVTTATSFEPPPGRLAVVEEVPAPDRLGQPARDGAPGASGGSTDQPAGIDQPSAEAARTETSDPPGDGRRHYLFGDVQTTPPDPRPRWPVGRGDGDEDADVQTIPPLDQPRVPPRRQPSGDGRPKVRVSRGTWRKEGDDE